MTQYRLFRTLLIAALIGTLTTSCATNHFKPAECNKTELKGETVRDYLIQREGLLADIDNCNLANGYTE